MKLTKEVFLGQFSIKEGSVFVSKNENLKKISKRNTTKHN